jgi:hypothetical protein
MEEVGVELESTEEIEDLESEEFVIIDNESKDLDKVSKKQKNIKKKLVEKAEEQSEKDVMLIGKVNNNNDNSNNNNSNNNNNNHNSNNNNNDPPPIPKAKSLTSQLLTLTISLNLLKKVKGLEEAIQLLDESKQYFSSSREVFKCNGYFNKDKIFEGVKPNLWWIILVGLILAVIFTTILNSYWPTERILVYERQIYSWMDNNLFYFYINNIGGSYNINYNIYS